MTNDSEIVRRRAAGPIGALVATWARGFRLGLILGALLGALVATWI